ncbi:MAG: sulfatase [Salinarimonadaceae bacterium]|nr:MAG: sulfatase [Salinarimonadaceae bacterium]
MNENAINALKIGLVLLAIWMAMSLLVGLPPFVDALFGVFHWSLSLEVGAAMALVCVLAVWRRRVGGFAVHAVAGVLTLLVALRIADLTARSVVDRPLNLFLDVSLLPALWDVTVTLLGTALALLAVAAALIGLVVTHYLFVALLRFVGRGFTQPATARAFALLACAALAVFVVQRTVFAETPGWRPVGASASQIVYEQTQRVAWSLASRAAFRASLADDPADAIPQGAALSRLAGRDVLIIYIESYGVTALDEPEYAAVVAPRVEAFGERVAQAGFSSRSGRLVAVTVGGQSWLNHATLSSGRHIGDQTLYSLFLAEQPRTLVHDFSDAGWRSVQIKPAITMPWPEGQRLGYEATWEAADMGYRGPQFYWGIVPDQFALDFFARTELETAPRAPVFASVALISSHAPWLPVPDVVAWEELGDGSVYERWTEGAPAPREVWRDQLAVRRQYALSVAHSLDAVAKFIADRVDPSALVVVLGDHQPAPLVTGPDASRAVPVHVLSGDEALLEAFADLGFVDGMKPPPAPLGGDATLPGMEAFRPFLLEAFSGLGFASRAH